MWPDIPVVAGASSDGTRFRPLLLSLPITTNVSTPTDHVRLALHYDEPVHPLNRRDTEGVFDLAFRMISEHNLKERFPRRGGKIQAGNVMIEMKDVTEDYSWGLFDYTLRQVMATQEAVPGWWSCAWGCWRLMRWGR